MKKISTPFIEAKKIVHTLKLKSGREWREFCKSGKKPFEIPANPALVYKNKGWKGVGDWLGTGTVATFDKQYKPFIDARNFARSLKFSTRQQWIEYCMSNHKPEDIPRSVHVTYKKDWKGWGDFLGTGVIAARDRKFKSYENSKKFLITKQFKNRSEFISFKNSGKLPEDIPKDPPTVYKNKGWKGWGNFLGTDHVFLADSEWKSFDVARKFAQSLGLKSSTEWRDYCKSGKKPKDFPNDPRNAYLKKGWKGWGHFLGTGNLSPSDTSANFKPFKEAKQYVQKLNLISQKEWNEYRKSGKKPADIPSNPAEAYEKEWTNWGDWLGTGFVAFRYRSWLPWKDAKSLYQKIFRENKLKNKTDWEKFIKKNKLPKKLPIRPWEIYTEARILRELKKK